jgi:tetratricopeptide (TPR) repeat protein
MSASDFKINSLLASAIDAHQRGHLIEAAELYAKLLKISPQHSDATHLIGLIAFQSNNFAEAKKKIKLAIKYDANILLYYANLGRVCMAMGEYTAACDAWLQALTLEPDSYDTHFDLSGAFLKLGKFEKALAYADAAINLQGTNPEVLINKTLAHNNLANEQRDQMCFGEAIINYIEALKISPNESDVHSNLGVAYQEQGDTEQAILCYIEAIRLDTNNAEAHRNLGMAYLQIGDFNKGWKEYEWRWKTHHFKILRRNWSKPSWSGCNAKTKTLLVHCEQGFGDTLQFSRYLPLVAKKVNRLIVEAPKELVALLQRIDGVNKVLIAGKPLPIFDLQIPMLSLPYAFQTSIDTVPAKIPYLNTSDKKVHLWLDLLAKKEMDVLVGLAWRGGETHQRNALRSPGLEVFENLLHQDQNIRFICLQKDQGAEDISKFHWAKNIEFFSEKLESFDDTAALVSCLDIVITPDTAIAHLSGGLGIHTMLMLPKISEWRWLQEGQISPWYPNTTIIRQKNKGGWDSVVSNITLNIMEEIKPPPL